MYGGQMAFSLNRHRFFSHLRFLQTWMLLRGKRGVTFSYLNLKLYMCGCDVKQFPSKIELTVWTTVHTEQGLRWQLHPWCHKLAARWPDCTTVAPVALEIALNKLHCVHHWLHYSPCATDPKKKSPKTVWKIIMIQISCLCFSPSLPSTFPSPSGSGGRKVRQHPSAGGGGISGVWDDFRCCCGGGAGYTHLGGVVLQGWKLCATRILPQTQSPNA